MLPNLPDLPALLARARDGNPMAIRELYEAYGAAVHRYCYVRLGDREAAQDCTQEVFVHLWQGAQNFEYRGAASFTAWVYTIASHTVASYGRKRLRAHHVSLTPALNLADDRSSDTASTICERATLCEALRHLTVEQQQVITLKFFGGLSNRELAIALGRSEGAIKALQHRALHRLQQLLATEYTGRLTALPLVEVV